MSNNQYDDVTDFQVEDWTKTQKSKYLENKTFFLHMKKNYLLHIKGYIWQKSFLAETTINSLHGVKLLRTT